MDSWDIKIRHKITLIGIINRRIENLVFKYSGFADRARSDNALDEIERELIYTLSLHAIIAEIPN